MADPPPYPGTPRWVKVFGTIVIVVLVAFFTVLFTHGPHRGPASHTAPAGGHK